MSVTSEDIMVGAPPAPQHQATLANWRTHPFSPWAFHHVREIVPTANIACDVGRALQSAEAPLEDVQFEDGSGGMRSFHTLMSESWTTGLVVLHRGKIVMEHYGHGYDGTAPHIVFSISKSITAVVAGVLQHRGVLDPAKPVTTYIPETAGTAYGDCTVQHVLDMTVSCSFEESYLEPEGDYAKYRASTGWNPPIPSAEGADAPAMREFLLTLRPGSVAHGEVFNYLSPNSDLMGWVIERASGRRFADVMRDVLWAPMGAEVAASITVDRIGAPRTAGGINVTTRDLARFGELMRQGGRVGGLAIVPSGWVEDTLTHRNEDAWRRGEFSSLLPNGGYRNAWYQTGFPSGAFCGMGIHGQWVFVDPTAEVVIARTAAQPEPVDEPLDLLHLMAFHAVARHLEATA